MLTEMLVSSGSTSIGGVAPALEALLVSPAAENDRRVLQLPYHGANTALVSTHDVRLPKDSTVGDLLEAFMQQLPAEKRPRELRLLEIFNCKIYQARLA